MFPRHGLPLSSCAAAILCLSALGHAQVVSTLPVQIPTIPTKPLGGLTTHAKPTIIVGDPSIPDFPSAFDAINGNDPDSPLAGVVSVYGALFPVTGVLGSGVALDPYHIITAAHVVDFAGGLTPEGAVTGDGHADALMPYSRIYLNNIAAPDPITIDSIQIAPGWNGFRNVNAADGGSDHNDLAILTLHTPLPAGVPLYPIYRTDFAHDTAKIILMSGYGGGGDEAAGITQPASFDIKRYGWNIAGTYEFNADNTKAELYLADFDPPAADGGPDFDHGGFDGFTSLGNDFESIIAPGDSGGAAFLVDDLNNDGIIEPGELTLFGLTTITFDTASGAWPHFGAGFGGPILSAYQDFIDSATGVPEPASLALFGFGVLAMLRRCQRQLPRI